MSYEKHLSKCKSTSYCEFLMSSRTLLAPFTRASLMLPFVVIASYKALFIGSQSFDISGIEG